LCINWNSVLLSHRSSYRFCVNNYNEGICGCGVPGNICPVGMLCSSNYLVLEVAETVILSLSLRMLFVLILFYISLIIKY